MKEINLRDYYPFYTQDIIVEVPDEVANLLREYKLAEAAVIEEIIDQKPVLLLDDVMSELDGRRRDALVTAMEGGSQTFITTANIDYFNEAMLNKSNVIHLPLV